MKEKIVKLKNGGTFIYSKTKINNCSAVEVGFSVGSFADEKPGTAHFLEHTLFKKTKNRTNQEVDTDRNRIVYLNASTSMDYLFLKFYRTNKLIDKSMDFAYDVLMNSVIDDEYVESEKGVIKEELNMCLDNESRDVYVMNNRQIFSNAQFASDIVGKTERNISEITFEDLKKFKDKHFVGNNFFVSMVTSFSFHKAKKLINKNFASKIQKNEEYQKPSSYFEKSIIDTDSSLKINKNNQEKVSVLLSFKIEGNEVDIFTKNYNYSFLTRYISGPQGDLFLKLRNKGLIYRLDSDISSYKKESLLNIMFETSKEKIKDIVDIISDKIKKITTTMVDFETTQAYQKNSEFFEDEKLPVMPISKCHYNLMDFLSYGKLFKLKKRQKKQLRKGVTPENVLKAAKEIFNKNNQMYVTVLGNVAEKNIPTMEYFKENFLVAEN